MFSHSQQSALADLSPRRSAKMNVCRSERAAQCRADVFGTDERSQVEHPSLLSHGNSRLSRMNPDYI
jgi:hypothetical protein